MTPGVEQEQMIGKFVLRHPPDQFNVLGGIE